MGELEHGEELISSPSEGTWKFGARLRDSFGKWNWIVDAGDIVGCVNLLNVQDLHKVDFKSTAVIARHRGFVREVLSKDGTEVIAGTPLLLVKILSHSA